MVTNSMKYPNYKRVLPELTCPLCGGTLKELRHSSPTAFILAWVCDCKEFKRMEGLVKTNWRDLL